MMFSEGCTRELTVSSYSDGFFSDSEEIEEDEHPKEETTIQHTNSLRHVFIGVLLFAGAATCLLSLAHLETKSSAPSVTNGMETTTFWETHEFRSLMSSNIKGMMESVGAKDDRIDEHVNNSIASLTHYIGKHATEAEKNKVRNARLNAQAWETVRAFIKTYSDTRVQDVGRVVVEEMRRNVLAGPSEIGKRVAARLEKDHTLGLAQDLLPAKLRTALYQRWASSNVKEDDMWKTVLDPTGETFKRIHVNTTGTNIKSSALIASSRSLRSGPWKGPFKLNAAELTLGITSCVLLSAMEIIFHIDLYTHAKHIALPHWVYYMIAIPSLISGAIDCEIGLSFWCQYFLGVLGANALEGIIVIPLFHQGNGLQGVNGY